MLERPVWSNQFEIATGNSGPTTAWLSPRNRPPVAKCWGTAA